MTPDEWGPARGDRPHRLSLFGRVELPRNVQLALNARAQAGAPCNITTGRDENGDTVFNDRPEGVGRNAARADGMFRLDVRLSWRIGIGAPRDGYGADGDAQVRQGGGRQRGAMTSPFFG